MSTVTKIRPEKSLTRNVVVAQALIRPTGLLDPEIIVKPIKNQADDILEQVRIRTSKGQRVLVTTLTKKFAEELDLYFKQINVKSAYIHSDVDTLDRLDILADLRRGKYDVLIGINLLREGLDLPEVSLVAIFDADKEGFLRSRTSLIQTIGRAARHEEGQVIMYADTITRSMKEAMDETERRREIQIAYNKEHGITPKSTTRQLNTIADDLRDEVEQNNDFGKAGARLTTQGFVPIDRENKEVQDGIQTDAISLDNMMLESRFSRKNKPLPGKSARGKQVYDDFDIKKDQLINDLKHQNLSVTELQERLQIAIDAMDFEMAAAIRDTLAGQKN